ncbi:hypothetical protein QUB20_07820 [Microcoleus sp. B4-C2]
METTKTLCMVVLEPIESLGKTAKTIYMVMMVTTSSTVGWRRTTCMVESEPIDSLEIQAKIPCMARLAMTPCTEDQMPTMPTMAKITLMVGLEKT